MTEQLLPKHYTSLSNDLKVHGFDFYYNSPELWCCQDYPIYFDWFRLMNQEGILLIPPLGKSNYTHLIQNHLAEIGECIIIFAPHNIKDLIHPLIFNRFRVEQTDNNYINSTDFVVRLQGNRLKKLRNNVNNFKLKLEARPLTKQDLPKAVELCRKYHFQSSEYDDVSLNTKILENLETFNLIQRGYWLDGELVAFNVGAPLYSTTASFLISKSKHDIKYLVDYVRYDFHRQALEKSFVFVNDGSDLDSEGLKQLKKKFAPISVLPVYSMEWK